MTLGNYLCHILVLKQVILEENFCIDVPPFSFIRFLSLVPIPGQLGLMGDLYIK